MGGFNPPVPQNDSNWEIRVAVLLSLFLQALLIFLGPTRKRYSNPLPCFAVWSCYLLADWVADLALGLILNNIGGGNNGSGSPVIFAFWTPFLLLHLGGPDTITAYSLEDNELWLRHLIGLLFELFSACVIFFCSLRGNPLIHATVVMFVVGIIKYGERTYSLYCGSLEGFRNNILGPPDPGRNYARFMTEFDSKEKAGLVVEIAVANGEAKDAQMQMERQETTRLVLATDKSVEMRAYDFFRIFRRLFVNLILSFKERRLSQAFFLEPGEAFQVIELELSFIYDMLYTKAPVAHTRTGLVLRCVCSVGLVSALVSFFLIDDKQQHSSRVDVIITYALLLGALALDMAALVMLVFSDRAAVFLSDYKSRRWLIKWLWRATQAVRRWWQPRHWSRTVARFSLIGYSVRNGRTRGGSRWRRLMAAAVPQILKDFTSIRHQSLRKIKSYYKKKVKKLAADHGGGGDHEEEIEVVAVAHVEESSLLEMLFFEGVKKDVTAMPPQGKQDKDHIMEVCNRRGKGVIQRLLNIKDEPINITQDDVTLITDSVEKSDFDESLLLWHIATDLCLFDGDHDHNRGRLPWKQDTARWQAIGETLSEYMLYLLIKQPEMLLARAGIWLMRYRDTCEEAERFFASMAAWNPSHDDARRMLLSVNTTMKPSEVKGDRSNSVLFDAVRLAKVLRKLDETLMWELVTGVWGEMLTYAAQKCPGSTHARQLSHGGELITVLWLLMEHMGLDDMYDDTGSQDLPARIIVHDH